MYLICVSGLLHNLFSVGEKGSSLTACSIPHHKDPIVIKMLVLYSVPGCNFMDTYFK